MGYPEGSSEGDMKQEEQGCSGVVNEGVGEVKGQVTKEFRMGPGGGSVEVLQLDIHFYGP